MLWKDYVEEAMKTAVFPQEDRNEALIYCQVAFVGEVGELMNKIKKVLRRDVTMEAQRAGIVDEIGDCLWYLAALAHVCETPVHDGYAFPDAPRVMGTDYGVVVALAPVMFVVVHVVSDAKGGALSYIILDRIISHLSAIAAWWDQSITLSEAAEANLKKLRSRAERGTIQGDGDVR